MIVHDLMYIVSIMTVSFFTARALPSTSTVKHPESLSDSVDATCVHSDITIVTFGNLNPDELASIPPFITVVKVQGIINQAS